MIWVAFFIALLISAGAIFFVVWPLVTTKVEPYYSEADHLTELISRKDAALSAIKDLEFDYQVGKVSEEDYQRFDARLRRQAIVYIQQIEKLAPQTASLEQQLEAEIATQRRTLLGNGSAQSLVKPGSGEDTPILAAQRFCTSCGNAVEVDHKFCGKCGTPVKSTAVLSNG